MEQKPDGGGKEASPAALDSGGPGRAWPRLLALPRSADALRLQLVKAALVLVLVLMPFVGYRRIAWPVITWPMYARLFEMPQSPVSELRVVVVTAGGQRIPLGMREISPIGEHNIVERITIWTLMELDPVLWARNARTLEVLAHRAVPGRELDALEIWEATWDADVRALPPLDPRRPDAARRLGRVELPVVREGGRP